MSDFPAQTGGDGALREASTTRSDLTYGFSPSPSSFLRPSAQDIPLTCKDCSNGFVFSVQDQEFFRSKGWDNQPVR